VVSLKRYVQCVAVFLFILHVEFMLFVMLDIAEIKLLVNFIS